MHQVEVLILGAGAAGLMCAAKAAARGRHTLVLDHANKAGKKILMSGGGRCNFTNYYISPQKYLSHNPHFCKSALKRYTQWDFIALLERHGIPYHEKHEGQLFCDHKANAILDMLLTECSTYGAHIRLNTQIHSIEKHQKNDKPYYVVSTSSTVDSKQQEKIECESLIIATGGPSIPTLGASQFGYQIAKQFGLQIYEPRAGLVPLTASGPLKDFCSALSGTALKVEITHSEQSFKDDLLFTHRGLSGPAILQISSYWQLGETLSINLLPDHHLHSELRQAQHQRPKVLLKNWLAELTTTKFAEHWLARTPFSQHALAQLNGQDIDAIAHELHHWQVKPSGSEGYRTAEVTLGGVNTDELSSKTLESKKHSGLFFIGEVVDVSGWLGGYNFQWAWSSAAAAAQYC